MIELNCYPKGIVNQLEEVRKTLSRLEYYLMAMAVENAIKLVLELESIKKQDHSAYVQSVDRHGDCYIHGVDEFLKKVDLLYSKPVYQHSFTVDGHTFYADSAVDILYLERKFGVGGKAKLEAVKGD